MEITGLTILKRNGVNAYLQTQKHYKCINYKAKLIQCVDLVTIIEQEELL